MVGPISVALLVLVDCSVNRSGLGGMGGTTVVTVDAGGGAAGAGGMGGGAIGGSSGTGGRAGDGGNVGGGGAPVDSSQPDDGGGPSDVPPATTGCADGTREAFTDEARFPSIAGCAGGWSVPGLLTEASMAPGCARAAGNDGSNRMGTACTVEDLCADGWHVCRGASELTLMAVTCRDAGIAPASAGGSGAMFFATRQRGTAPTGCSPDATTGSNNLHGCGNFGRAEDPGCAPPLDRQIENTACATNPPWSCNDAASIMTEAMVATKSGAAAGGVLCCR